MTTNNQRRSSKTGRQSSVGKALFTTTQHRLSLQGPISYRKSLEFPADGPGRVIVRLERLMGSDRIRITDTKYMATLLQRLQEEEEVTWQKRTFERRKAEHNRFRQLVIDGYTEPTPAMADLYNHPVFRVNRILNRLNRLNNAITPTINLPRIIPVEPFTNDESGRVFKSYPGHFSIARETGKRYEENVISILNSPNSQRRDSIPEIETSEEEMTLDLDEHEYDEDDAGTNLEGEFYSKIGHPKYSQSNRLSAPEAEKHHTGHIVRPAEAQIERITGHKLSRTSIEKLVGHIGFSTLPVEARINGSISKSENQSILDGEEETRVEGPKVLTLHEIQKIYGVAPNTDLGVQWKPYQSPIVEMVFEDDQRGVGDLCKMGTEIVDMYDRQQQTTNDYIESLLRKSEKVENERSTVNNEDVVEEENDIDGDGDFPGLSETGEYFFDELQGLGETDVPLEPLSDVVVSPTWDNLEGMWEEETDSKIEEEFDEHDE